MKLVFIDGPFGGQVTELLGDAAPYTYRLQPPRPIGFTALDDPASATVYDRAFVAEDGHTAIYRWSKRDFPPELKLAYIAALSLAEEAQKKLADVVEELGIAAESEPERLREEAEDRLTDSRRESSILRAQVRNLTEERDKLRTQMLGLREHRDSLQRDLDAARERDGDLFLNFDAVRAAEARA